jgi:hypothetical protein
MLYVGIIDLMIVTPIYGCNYGANAHKKNPGYISKFKVDTVVTGNFFPKYRHRSLIKQMTVGIQNKGLLFCEESLPGN